VEVFLESDSSVAGDYQELHSAVSNLILNAIKYSPPDTPVTVTWSLQSGHPVLSVRDRGVGIDEVHIPRLTERFYRVDKSRSSQTGGTGLGLAIVKHVAASHGATLDIQSQPGKGSTFALHFPPE
jgi:two-component system phosphate regulon sensor histidine kinase PhoR